MTPMQQDGVMFCYVATIFVHMVELKLQSSYVGQEMSPEPPKWWVVNKWNFLLLGHFNTVLELVPIASRDDLRWD